MRIKYFGYFRLGMKIRTTILFTLVSVLIFFLMVFVASCTKEESCAKRITYEWKSDTLLVPYSGKEILKFNIVDSNGNKLDSVVYIGEGVSKRRVEGKTDFAGCNGGVIYFHPVKDWVYYNKSSPKDKLYISVIIDDISSDIMISLTESINSFHIPNSYRNSGAAVWYNFNGIQDTVISGKQYYNLALLGTPSEQRIHGRILYSLFSKDYGIVSIEESPTRFWHIVN